MEVEKISDSPSKNKGTSSSHVKDGIIDLTAGVVGGIANVYGGQPLDTVKVKMQAFPLLYPNWISCATKTFKLEGFRGLYAGTVPALVANVAENAVLFTAYGYCQKIVAMLAGKDNPLEMSPILNGCAGSIAAVFAAGVLCPTELVKCKLQAQAELNPLINHNAFQMCRQIYKTNGIRAFFVGMTPTLVREVPGYFSLFGAYEFSRHMFTAPGKTKDDIGLVKTACSGAIGGMALWALAFPADVIKSRIQISGTGTFGTVFFDILKNEGIPALYKGLTPTLIRTCSASSCLFIAYESTKRFLHSL